MNIRWKLSNPIHSGAPPALLSVNDRLSEAKIGPIVMTDHSVGDDLRSVTNASVSRCRMADNPRGGGFFELGPSGRAISGQRLVVCAGASL